MQVNARLRPQVTLDLVGVVEGWVESAQAVGNGLQAGNVEGPVVDPDRVPGLSLDDEVAVLQR